MSNTASNTPVGVSNTPSITPVGAPGAPSPHPSPELARAFAAFAACLHLTRAAIEAEAAVETLGSDPSVMRFADAAADAWARADEAFWAFRFGRNAPSDLSEAAWVFLLLFEDDGDDLARLSQRGGGIRHRAQVCARSPLPGERILAEPLHAAADLLEEMIWIALADHTARTGQEEPWTDWGL
ncbi:hypothetical protein EU805_15520 [Salipiger sp. IMCC34102]|uniref:hypothetical protein n=1 Tax=Salipiger sp. IMCC34102 TaxID=2510647 RepID=UPI00101BD2E3|nr:hypothetical protein [Salipiger sp. IMCC34102]RYH01015.1 hypothetical protein EU805_15520 [Salipiger sp. IMCC34102]